MNEKRTSTENLHCALKHAYVLPTSFLEITQKTELIYEQTKNEKVKEYIRELNKLKVVTEDIISILEEVYFFNKKITFDELNTIKVNIRIIRNKLEIETKKMFKELAELEIKEKNLVENAFFDDYRILMSNLIHLEIHLSYVYGVENDGNSK